MPVIAEATAQARLLTKRGATAAAVVLGASFHPVRTVREGASLVRGLVHHADGTATPAAPPTDAQPKPTPAAKASTTTSTTTSKGSGTTAKPKAGTAKKTPGHTTVQKPAAPPTPDPAPEAVDVPVEPQGPVPHIPPSIAGEVERDYGDDLPGIRGGEG